MAGNTFGTLFRITTFGESHGYGIGVVIDGCYPGIKIDIDFIRNQLNKRKPGQSFIHSQRNEADEPEIISGIAEGLTTGAPLTILIRNKDQRSEDYDQLKNVYRPSHADYSYTEKYGLRDYRGSGRASARETAARVAAGAIAQQMLLLQGISVVAWVHQIGDIAIPQNILIDHHEIYTNDLRCPHQETRTLMQQKLEQIKAKGDTLGGIIAACIKGAPAGLGEPVFDKFHAQLGKAMLSINAVKGFEIGSGFEGAAQTGSSQNDIFTTNNDGRITTKTNNSGGVQGGITNGMDIHFKVAFKPVSTLMMEQTTIDQKGNPVTINPKGRHDVCVVPRATPIVEAMAAMVTLDFIMQQQALKRKPV
jgi:chorismate synthase